MQESQPKARTAKTIVAIYSASLLCQLANSLSLVTQGVVDTYPGVTLSSAQGVLSVSSLFILFGSLAAGKLANYTTKKNIVLICVLLDFVSGLLGYFCTFNLAMVYVAGCVAGFASGALLSAVLALIPEHFQGKQCALFMGLQSVAISVGAMLINGIGGAISAIYWKNIFLVYIVIVVINIIVALLMPKGKVEKPETGEKVKVFTPFVGIMILFGFFVGVQLITLNANITMYVYELGIGNEAQSGLVTTAYAVGSLATGLGVTFLMKFFKKRVFAAALVCGAVGLWLLALVHSVAVFMLAGFLIGCCFNLHNVCYYTIAPMNAAPAAVTMSISLYTAGMTLGMVLGPFIVTPLGALLGDSISCCFVVGAILLTVMAVLELFLPRILHGYQLELPEEN